MQLSRELQRERLSVKYISVARLTAPGPLTFPGNRKLSSIIICAGQKRNNSDDSSRRKTLTAYISLDFKDFPSKVPNLKNAENLLPRGMISQLRKVYKSPAGPAQRGPAPEALGLSLGPAAGHGLGKSDQISFPSTELYVINYFRRGSIIELVFFPPSTDDITEEIL